jgi:Ca2+:H+ antiporter
VRPVHALGIFIPIAVVLELAHAAPLLVFSAAALGVIPTAAVMGEATEHIAAKTGPGIGGFMNVTFGNAPELIIAFFALKEGLQEVVKASIVGSIIGNILLVLGAAMLVGGWNREKQTFNKTAAGAQSGMLLLALCALILPAIFQLVHGGGLPSVGDERVDFGSDLEHLSFAVALVLMASYAAGLLFSLKTHRKVFNPFEGDEEDHAGGWTIRKSLVLLGISAVLVGVMSEVLVGSISEASEEVGLSEFFVGVFIVAIVGNAAEHGGAVVVAYRGKIKLAAEIALASSAQVAVFLVPAVALLAWAINPLALSFRQVELAVLGGSVVLATALLYTGHSSRARGVILIAAYVAAAVAFFIAGER